MLDHKMQCDKTSYSICSPATMLPQRLITIRDFSIRWFRACIGYSSTWYNDLINYGTYMQERKALKKLSWL